MQIVTVTYDSGVLHVKCSGEFGVGSAGNSSAERMVRTIQRWMSRRAEPISEIEIDYTDVTYVWGDGPVSSMIPFFSQGVVKCRVIASPQNWEPLKTLLSSCRVPFFELTEAGAEPRFFSTLHLERDSVQLADPAPERRQRILSPDFRVDIDADGPAGYRLLRLMELLMRDYEHSDVATGNAPFLSALRSATAFLSPVSYRGISRDPLEPFGRIDLQILRETGEAEGLLVNARARRRFHDLLGDDDVLGDAKCLSSLDQAREIHALLDEPFAYEIVLLDHATTRDSHTLGFDVGYVRGDHFSLICDTVVMPRWHPPHPDDVHEVADHLRELNQHLLFTTAGLAEQFRRYYMGKKWAEVDDFYVIRVSTVTVST